MTRRSARPERGTRARAARALALLLFLLPQLGARAQEPDPLRRLETWVERRVRAGDAARTPLTSELRELVRGVRELEEREPARADEALGVLLRLAALERPEGVDPGETPAGLGRRELAWRVARGADGRAARALAQASAQAERPLAERVEAARQLAGQRVAGTLGPLLAAAAAPERALASLAQEALAGWADVGLEAFFLDELEQGRGSQEAIRAHFTALRGRLGADAASRLRTVVGRMLVDEDWRVAARARALVPCLETEAAVPALVEALGAWARRARAGDGALRIRSEIAGELRRVSGRNLGLEPEAWRRWLERVQAGTIELPGPGELEAYTAASFFGLPVVSDRVLFVLDRSGSMEQTLGSAGPKRFRAAVDQLQAYLERAGPGTRFDVVLFEDRTVRFASPELVQATPAQRERLRRWLDAKSVGGGTRLREAVLEAVGYRRGQLALEELQADTVVVLCDGETESGPGWVAPWLDEVQDRAQLRFLCVQIGRQGDGTLEALAARDGQVVRVE